jgi:hypothetical protein
LVGLTAGLVKPRKLTWKGSSKNAPETPPMDVKNETANATTGGSQSETSTPETEKTIPTSMTNSDNQAIIQEGLKQSKNRWYFWVDSSVGQINLTSGKMLPWMRPIG